MNPTFCKVILFCICLQPFFYLEADPTLKEIFSEEYQNPFQSLANPPSLSILQKICKKLQVQSVVDAGCGNALWAMPLTKSVQYIGVDIVSDIIKSNRQKFKNSASFHLLDIIENELPESDLIFCRDCLNYLSYVDILNALEKFVASGCEYVCLNTTPLLESNEETSSGIRRELNFNGYPFLFPKPLMTLPEEKTGSSLAVWKLSTLNLSILSNYLFPPLSVLTKAIGGPQEWEHAGVANSARRGLAKVHRQYNFNPDSLDELYENVVVLANIAAGQQVYLLKQARKINTLLIGPNVVASPTEFDFFLTWPLIDRYLANCTWVKENFIRFCPVMESRIRFWYAGVEETFWKPKQKFSQKKNKKVLLYRKTDEDVADAAQVCLEQHGYEVFSIRYGQYSLNQYKDMLDKCRFAVVISCSESQGLALAEAWSMDVPTLIWNPKNPIEYAGHVYENVSSSPYLNSAVGKDWVTIEELEQLLGDFEKLAAGFQPRRWVLLNMTDKISIEKLLVELRAVFNTQTPAHSDQRD